MVYMWPNDFEGFCSFQSKGFKIIVYNRNVNKVLKILLVIISISMFMAHEISGSRKSKISSVILGVREFELFFGKFGKNCD